MSDDERFIEEYRPLVLSIARKMRARYDLTTELDDLIALGFEGLLDARQRYDPERGVKFNTFAYYRVRGAMIDGVRKAAFHGRRAWEKIRAAEAADQIAESAGERRAADPASRADVARTAASLDDALGKLTASYIMASVGQGEDSVPEDAEEALISKETAGRLREAVAKLPEREQALVRGFYFEGRRFDHVAEELGISKSWASRLHTKALGLLREAIESE